MEPEHLSEDLKLFLDETEEILGTLEESLMAVERDGPVPETIQEVFRAAHTLKGSSATAGFAEMATVTHHLENLIAGVRDGTLVIDSDLVDVMLETVDWLRLAKRAIETGQPQPDPATMIMRLESLEQQRETAPERPNPSRDTRQSALPSISDTAEPALDKPRRLVEIEFDTGTPMVGVRMFQAVLLLEGLGTVCSSSPSLEDIENDRLVHPLRVYLSTDVPEGTITKELQTIEGVQSVKFLSWESQDIATQTSLGAGPALPRAVSLGSREKSQSTVVYSKSLSQTVRVDVALIDTLMNLVGELIIDRTRLGQLISDLRNAGVADDIAADLASTTAHLQRITTEIQEGIMRARLMPLRNLLKKYPRMVRDLAARSGKEVEFLVEGEDTELDRSVIETLDDPLIHLLRNAVDHGIESPEERIAQGKPRQGRVTVTASHQENHVVIVVSDDGKGIDPEKVKRVALKKGLITEDAAALLTADQAVDLIFMPGFSTAESVNETSGRGVGLDVVRTNLKRINGSLQISTAVGRGTSFIMRLPLTLAIVKALLVHVLGETYAIPVSAVQEVVELEPSSVRTIAGREVVLVRQSTYPLVRLNKLFSRDASSESLESRYAVIVSTATAEVAFAVEGIAGEQEIVVKSLGKMLRNITGLSGATILGQGDVALILDVHALVSSLERTRIA